MGLTTVQRDCAACDVFGGTLKLNQSINLLQNSALHYYVKIKSRFNWWKILCWKTATVFQ